MQTKIIYFLLFTIVFFNFACKKQEDIVVTPIVQPDLLVNGYHINCDALIKLIPDNLKNAKEVTFINSKGIKKIFNVKKYDNENNTAILNNIKYSFDTYLLIMQLQGDPYFNMGFTIGASFTNSNKYVRGLDILYRIFDNQNSGTSNTIVLDMKDEMKEKEQLSGYVASKSFNGKVFKDVYVSPKWNNKPKSSEVSFNTEFGIVAFKDLDDDLFVLDSIK